MKSLDLALVILCNLLLASCVLYPTIISASPIAVSEVLVSAPVKPADEAPKVILNQAEKPLSEKAQLHVSVESIKEKEASISGKSDVPSQSSPVVVEQVKPVQVVPNTQKQVKPASPIEPVLVEPQIPQNSVTKQESVVNKIEQSPLAGVAPELVKESPKETVKEQEAPVEVIATKASVEHKLPIPVEPLPVPSHLVAPIKAETAKEVLLVLSTAVDKEVKVTPTDKELKNAPIHQDVKAAPVVNEIKAHPLVSEIKAAPVVAPHRRLNSDPTVNGGLGPLNLLAATLCKYHPEKLVVDDNLSSLYNRRASLRKSLFDFMSLKFTNLEKLSSKLNPGLEVVPPKVAVPNHSGVAPSHGWPVVGKCTAHDLRLMAEAAWCEPALEESSKVNSSSVASSVEKLGTQRAGSMRSVDLEQVANPSAVVSKLIQVNDVKEAPVVESSLASLNLTQQQQQQFITMQAQANSVRECKRNALRLTKSLLNHLAEDQKDASESWPKLYALMAEDDCARKRMIDIVSALSGFRGESSLIRRDNVEFAFAMDDLRTKVLESELTSPLTFDKQFIEVEQFLQQSVKLMLANIDPERARLTSMRYRTLMPGPVSADDQCIELHQRLLTKNYPTDCNPNQFGQLPDVLRMTASSLELWSIEKELAKHSAKHSGIQDYSASSVGAQNKQDVNQCISNLVAS